MNWTSYLTPGIGATGLLAIAVVMVLTGRLLPRSSVRDRLADKDQQIAAWRGSYERALAIQDEQQRQIAALLEASRTATRVIAAIPQAAGLNGAVSEGRSRELAADADQ